MILIDDNDIYKSQSIIFYLSFPRYPDEDPRLRRRDKNRPIRRNKEERRSFDERRMKAARKQMEREEAERRGDRRQDIGWDRSLMDHRPPPITKKPDAVAMWL